MSESERVLRAVAAQGCTQPNERPIIFSGPMVRAILDGRKTMTRRVLKHQPLDILAMPNSRKPNMETWATLETRDPNHGTVCRCRYGVPGDCLWVRESFTVGTVGYYKDKPIYREALERSRMGQPSARIRWKPSIHMPRWASRLTLEIVSVRVERLQDIPGRDVLAEGIDNGKSNPTMGKRWENMQRMAFQELWDSLNAKRGFGWDTNPWVWVIEFKRLT